MKIYSIQVSLVLIILVISACHEHTHSDSHTHGETDRDHETELKSTFVTLTTDQCNSIDLRLGRIENRNLTSGFKASGYLIVPNQNRASVTSLYSGVVDKLFVMPGSQVSKGMNIASIVNPQFIQLQEEYLALEPKIALAEAEYSRQQELVRGNAGALKNLQAAEAETKGLRVRKAALEKQLQLMGIQTGDLSSSNLVTQISVKTPIGGSVSSVMVNLGAHVDTEIPIAEIVDNSQLHLDLYVYEKDLPLVRKNQSIDFILTNQPGRNYTAEVFSVGTTFEKETKATAVHCVVQGDKQGLVDGMSVTAQLNTSNTHVPALPAEAIVTHEGIDFVFIKTGQKDASKAHHDADNDRGNTAGQQKMEKNQIVFQRVPVKKGVSEFGFVEVRPLTSLPDDTEFVIGGAFFLMAKMMNAGEAHMH